MDNATHPGAPTPPTRLLDEIGQHRGWFLVLGALLIVFGVAAIVFPLMATLAAGLVLGWILLLVGAVQAVQAFRSRRWRGFLLQTLGAVLKLGLGALLLFFPLPSIASLTLLIGAYFLVEGAFRTALAFQVRGSSGWGWVLTGGLVSLVLGALVLAQWPAAAAWLLGMLLGIDLLFVGWVLVGLAWAAGRRRA